MTSPSLLPAALLGFFLATIAPVAVRAQAVPPPPYNLSEKLLPPADFASSGGEFTPKAINAQGYAVFYYVANANDPGARRTPLVYKGSGQFIELPVAGINFAAGAGFVVPTCISDVAADGSFFVAGLGKIDANDTVNRRAFVWKVNADGTASNALALRNIILPPDSQRPGEQSNGEAAAANSSGVIVGRGNSYLVTRALRWQYPDTTAFIEGDFYNAAVDVDELGNILIDTAPGFSYGGSVVPNSSDNSATPYATKAGFVVGQFYPPTSQSNALAFIYSAADGNGSLTPLPDYNDPNRPTTNHQSHAEHLNAARDMTGTSGSGNTSVLWKRQNDGSYGVFAASTLISGAQNQPFLDYTDAKIIGIAADSSLLVSQVRDPYSSTTANNGYTTVLLKPGADARPQVTSAPQINAVAGQPFSYQITATNNPTSYKVEDSLPAGLTLNSASGLISGTTPKAGSYFFTVSASNGQGVGAIPLGISLTVNATSQHPPFFAGETALANGVYYLQFANGTPFGYYSYLSDPRFIYHFDLGYEYWFDAQDGAGGIYFYDFKSQSFFFTSPGFGFPYLYDFSLNAVLYYFPDNANPGHYGSNPRYFFNTRTGQIITK